MLKGLNFQGNNMRDLEMFEAMQYSKSVYCYLYYCYKTTQMQTSFLRICRYGISDWISFWVHCYVCAYVMMIFYLLKSTMALLVLHRVGDLGTWFKSRLGCACFLSCFSLSFLVSRSSVFNLYKSGLEVIISIHSFSCVYRQGFVGFKIHI